ncbi:MAG: T9SS type A sorting domain-containing protein, partial [Bacteroidetes bacterium]|nr:T9SS type A sorting domain-containing protein [Bacteroidota bacterium]
VDATGKWIPTTATTASPNGLAFVQTRSVVLNSSFNSFGVGSSNSLPISLLSFTGAKKSSTVELLWKTASEVNAKEFQVERLDNANSFVQIGSVKAVGNTNRISMYSFVDNSPSKQSIRYYRLKMMDYDGNFKYSNVIKVSNENVGNEVTVFPNPTSEKISISNSNLNFASMSFKVMNLTGEVVKVGTASINEINVSDLAAGMYMISVTDEANEAITVKFIKN